ncbi:hypothetical protein AA958_08090 [Streptomyces sp. CNQ-509]|uniref:DUF4383 domain-containing protein n=1 Tax=unclassified Streptomyces TaxID=2593676 RepID=UPI00062DE5E3|nr:DUF4383 domain-containing protein [Streptomyces sp. CNQ-509]AKH82196.1 hypothetical protein AA958_08090 [Streptomyces sp. CNQ-509]
MAEQDHVMESLPHPLAEPPKEHVPGSREALKDRVNVGHPAHQHTKLDEHLPVDHHLSNVYRVGAGLAGLFLLVFGILGLIDRIGFFDTGGHQTLGLNSNGALSVLSIVAGVVLLYGMVRGGNFASTLNMVLGGLFVLSGFVNLAVLDTSWNFFAFRMQNVLFSFILGVVLAMFGMYGRVSGRLPHDNPYWRTRNAEEAAAEDEETAEDEEARAATGAARR